MSALEQHIIDAGYANRFFTERQLAEWVSGSAASRYGLVNRALKDGSLIRVKRGLYLLGTAHREGRIHPFAVAQALVPGSYVSFETALAHHGWIPETVFAIASVTPGRKTIERDHKLLGQFTFHPLALHDFQFLTSVERYKHAELTSLIAQPLRALMDLVALRKEHWSGLDWIRQGLRVEDTHLTALRRKDFAALAPVYKHKRVNEFLRALEAAVFDLKTLGKAKRPDHVGGAV